MKSWGDAREPMVSCCCTTYNHESFISDAIEGFLMQETNFPFEIIVRDDCSTDKTAEIVKEYAGKYPKIIKPIFEKENQFSKGVRPMPVIFKKAVGKYFALCEGDDYWTDENKLKKQVDFLENNHEYVITYSDVKAFDSNGDIKKNYGGVTRDTQAIELQKCISISTMTTCFRNVIKEMPPEIQCAKFGDLFMWSLLGHYGKGKYLDEIKPGRYRVHDGGVFSKQTTNTKLEMWLCTSSALFTYYRRIGNQELARHFQEKALIANLKLLKIPILLKYSIRRIKRMLHL